MATKKSTDAPSPESQVLAATFNWYGWLDKLRKHLQKRTFGDLKKEAAWTETYNRLQRETTKAGRELFALCRDNKPKKAKKAA